MSECLRLLVPSRGRQLLLVTVRYSKAVALWSGLYSCNEHSVASPWPLRFPKLWLNSRSGAVSGSVAALPVDSHLDRLQVGHRAVGAPHRDATAGTRLQVD